MIATPAVKHWLGTLRDVEGIQGSFVVCKAGGLLAKDLPAVFDDALFAVVGPRIVRFYDAMASRGEDVRHVVMRFAHHKLHLRPVAFGFVCALCDLDTNASALSMAMALVARGLEPELAAAEESVPASSPPPRSIASERPRPTTLPSVQMPEPTPPSANSPSSANKAPITYRGQRLG
ncbi:MAG TPA: hypothetical protein VK524_35005 [Polyangiaceae bacterium]|nr:hypothetical protein [Polyangiaceae bacterium]